jgi:formate hydrogenlyase subunit 6/NADH:ubiquinone oxidoreductase subunit I
MGCCCGRPLRRCVVCGFCVDRDTASALQSLNNGLSMRSVAEEEKVDAAAESWSLTEVVLEVASRDENWYARATV